MGSEGGCDFPIWALLPKRETNVSSFINKYPEYDGRGVRIAVFDSGIDPGAKGLQKTSDGRQKIVEMFDATGSGDVDTSTVVEASEGFITGLTGRKLKIPSHWENPSGKFHMGVKNAYQLYPKQLKDRIVKERKEKFWDPFHKQSVAGANRKFQDFNSAHSNITPLPQHLKFEKEELDAQLDVLASLEKRYHDTGPTYDCVVFHDGKQWRVVIDTSEKGDLHSCKLMGTYSETYDYAMLTPVDRLNYCVNVYDDGNLLEIVSQSTAHGTHVASIAAAYFPDNPEKNGVAPGAEVVSIVIGDVRLGSMETGAALIRAMIKVINSKCDVINMSYGEHANWSGGRVIELLHQLVDRHGVIMVCSAGNHGPALSTIGTPPSSISDSIIGVGAYVSPDMMLAEYSLREKIPGLGYTWTSRGPTFSGAVGVSVCAPGGAITSVPNWTLRSSQLMNGTSMSSPHVAGCISVLLSGLKKQDIAYSPYSIRRSIENTATKVNTWEPYGMGHGLIQVDKAFDHLMKYSDSMERFLRFHVTCNQKQGIYLRESQSTKVPVVFNLTVEPIYGEPYSDPLVKINFEMNLKLTCEASWVFVPSHLCLSYTARTFHVRIDPCGLPVGDHFTWIKAFDSTCIEKGPVFHFPITVIISRKLSTDAMLWNDTLSLTPGKVVREFIEVPSGATVASLRVNSCDSKNGGTIVVHAIQLRPQLSCKSQEYYKMFRLGPKEESVCVFSVKEKIVLELVIVLWWTSLEPTVINYNLSFRGLLPTSSTVAMHGADGIYRLDVHSSTSYEEMQPSAVLKSYVIGLRPSDYKIKPLKSRDVIPDGRQVYEIQLTYLFSITRSTEVTPVFSLLSELLYESEFESQMWMLFDCNKQLLAVGDAYPSKYAVKIEKGEYTVKLQVRHEETALLEKLSDVSMLISVKLQSNVSLDIYDKHSNALINGKKMSCQIIPPSCTIPVFLAPITCDKFPKSCSPGNYLTGNLTFFKDDAAKKADIYNIKYIVPELPRKSSTFKSNPDKEKTLEEEYSDEMKQIKTIWISKLLGKSSQDLFDEVLVKEVDNQYPIFLSRLQSLDKEYEKTSKEDKKHILFDIIKFADKILAATNTNDVLAVFGSKTDKKELPHYKKLEQQRSCIIEALVKKGKALCELYSLKDDNKPCYQTELTKENKESLIPTENEDVSIQTESPSPSDTQVKEDDQVSLEKIDEIFTELLKWCDHTDSKLASLSEKLSLVRGHYAKVLKLLLKHQDEKKNPDNEKRCIELFKKIGWNHCAEFFQRSFHIRYPPSYQLF